MGRIASSSPLSLKSYDCIHVSIMVNLLGTGNVDLSSYTIGDCIQVSGVCHVNMTVYGELGYVSMDVESVDLISQQG